MVPQHVGIIPDGNRRWARQQGLPSLKGHQAGVEAFRTVSRAAFDAGVKYITFFAFSTENWQRAEEEVGYLMKLFHTMIERELQPLFDEGVKFVWLGSRNKLDPKLVEALDSAVERTSGGQNGTLAVCLNYGGEQELADAAAQLVREGVPAEAITTERLRQALYAPELPPIDLVIRTSGEHRLSGFMLWRAAYAEFYLVDKNWPDFSGSDLAAALDDYAGRVRRFGT